VSPRPVIFISAVTRELRSARQLVSNTLTFLGYEPEWQDVFSSEQGDLRGMLRRRIDACKGVVQLVGQCYGAEPPTVDESFGRVSYTQYEALYAHQQKKKVWYLILNDDFTTDPHDPEPEELHDLQIAYRRRLKSENLIRYSFSSPEALEANVLKLRDDLNRLRRGVKQWAAAVAILLLVSVGLSLWLVQHQSEISHTFGKTVGALQGEAEKQSKTIEQANRTIKHTDQAANEMQAVSKRNDVFMRSVNSNMDLTVALSLLDRAQQSRDGSDQGQIDAIESLLARGHNYDNSDLSGISFRGAHLAKANFKGARLHFVNLTSVKAEGADFSDTGLRFARLDEGNFEGASLSQSYSPFLWGEKAIFNKANLSGANFFSADLRNASFRGANLKNTSFAFADLRGAHFDDADLTGAYFIGAVLDGAIFTGATIADTDFNAAAADNIKLTSNQLLGICRHESALKWFVKVLEQWPSNKYSTGLEYETIVDSQYEWSIENKSLPLRPAATAAKAAGFDAQFPAEQQFHLDRSYVEKAGRYEAVHDRVETHVRFLIQNLSNDRMLKVDGK